MKAFIVSVLIAFSGIALAAETKKVCVDKITNDGKPVLDKAGKPVQECKEIKVHKKLEGTKIQEKDKK